MIRVLQVTGIMNRGGAESMIMNLFRSIDRNKIVFDFVENCEEPALFDDEIMALGGRIYHCPHFTGKNYFQYRNWWKTFFSEHGAEYRIIHGHIGSCASIYLYLAKKNGLFTIAHSHSSSQSIAYRIVAYPTRYIADHFFGCSKAAVIDRYGKQVAASKRCNIIYNAIETEKYDFNETIRSNIRKELHLENRLIIGHVGRFVHPKNHGFLLELFKQYREVNEQAFLLLAGDGPLKEEMEQKAKQLGIYESCLFTGVRDDIHDLMQAMDVFVFPSFFEGLPVTLVEAQASGLPCIISENISDESILVDEICEKKSLEEPVQNWIDEIEKLRTVKRKGRALEVKQAGYDVKQTAKWMEEFYATHAG